MTAATQTFEQFFATAWPSAVRLASFLVQDEALGEDIAQDVLAMMYREWGRADHPDAYLRTSIYNAAKNTYRHRDVHNAKLPLLASNQHVDFVASHLGDAIAGLPLRQRAVIVLRYYSDLSEAEIAEVLGCRPGTVKSLASRALKALDKEISR